MIKLLCSLAKPCHNLCEVVSCSHNEFERILKYYSSSLLLCICRKAKRFSPSFHQLVSVELIMENFNTKPPTSTNRSTNNSRSNKRNFLLPIRMELEVIKEVFLVAKIIDSGSLVNCAKNLAIMWSNTWNYSPFYQMSQVLDLMVLQATSTGATITNPKLTLLHNPPMQIQIGLLILVFLSTMLPKTYKTFLFTLNMMEVKISFLVMVNVKRLPIQDLLLFPLPLPLSI